MRFNGWQRGRLGWEASLAIDGRCAAVGREQCLCYRALHVKPGSLTRAQCCLAPGGRYVACNGGGCTAENGSAPLSLPLLLSKNALQPSEKHKLAAQSDLLIILSLGAPTCELERGWWDSLQEANAKTDRKQDCSIWDAAQHTAEELEVARASLVQVSVRVSGYNPCGSKAAACGVSTRLAVCITH